MTVWQAFANRGDWIPLWSGMGQNGATEIMKRPRVQAPIGRSRIATCEHMLEGGLAGHVCGAEMQLIIKSPRVWSYQERVIERCTAGHIAHAQAVMPEPEALEPPIDDGPADCWGAF